MTTTTKPTAIAYTPQRWSADLLSYLHSKDPSIKVTANNVTNLTIWLHNEQSSSSWAADINNPLGVGGGGLSTAPNFGGILGGIQATGDLIRNSSNYTGIVNSLRSNAPAPIFASAVVNSPWNGNHYGGLSTFLSRGPLTTTTGQAPVITASEIQKELQHLAAQGASSGSTGVIPNWLLPSDQNIANVVTLGGTLPGRGAINGVANTIGDTVSAGVSVAKFLGKLSDPRAIRRVGVGALGVSFVIAGLTVFVIGSKPGQKAVGTATKLGLL